MLIMKNIKEKVMSNKVFLKHMNEMLTCKEEDEALVMQSAYNSDEISPEEYSLLYKLWDTIREGKEV